MSTPEKDAYCTKRTVQSSPSVILKAKLTNLMNEKGVSLDNTMTTDLHQVMEDRKAGYLSARVLEPAEGSSTQGQERNVGFRFNV